VLKGNYYERGHYFSSGSLPDLAGECSRPAGL